MDKDPFTEPVRRRIGDTEFELQRVFEGSAGLRRLICELIAEQRRDGGTAAHRAAEDT